MTRRLAAAWVVNPANNPPTSRAILIEPIDALMLATLLIPEAASVRLVDMDLDRLSSDDLVALAVGGCEGVSLASGPADPFVPPRLAVFVCDHHIPLHADSAHDAAVAAARALIERGWHTAFVGKRAALAHESSGFPTESALVWGEAEGVVVALARAAASGGWTPAGLSVVAGIRYYAEGHWCEGAGGDRGVAVDIESLALPDRSLVDIGRCIDVRTILTSRGCALSCGFCHVPGYWGGWRARSAASVAQEIGLLAASGARKILMLDDNALGSRRRMMDLCARLVDAGNPALLGCLGAARSFDASLGAAMRAAGFRWVHFGAESGDPSLMKDMGKATDPQRVEDAVTAAQSVGLRVRTSWILDLPGSDRTSLDLTRDAILRCASEEVRLHRLAWRLGSRWGTGRIGSQWIHERRFHALDAKDSALAEAAEQEIASLLAERGWAIVDDPEEFSDLAALARRSVGLRVASRCPMRYGLGWEPESGWILGRNAPASSVLVRAS